MPRGTTLLNLSVLKAQAQSAMDISMMTKENTQAEIAEQNARVSANETNISNSSWDSTKFYSAEDYVMHNNILYVCLMDCIGIEPSNELYWKSANIAEELNKLKSLIKKEEN